MAAAETAMLRAYELRAMLKTCALALDALEDRAASDEVSALRATIELAERPAVELLDAVDDLGRLAKVGSVQGPRDAA